MGFIRRVTILRPRHCSLQRAMWGEGRRSDTQALPPPLSVSNHQPHFLDEPLLLILSLWQDLLKVQYIMVTVTSFWEYGGLNCCVGGFFFVFLGLFIHHMCCGWMSALGVKTDSKKLKRRPGSRFRLASLGYIQMIFEEGVWENMFVCFSIWVNWPFNGWFSSTVATKSFWVLRRWCQAVRLQ